MKMTLGALRRVIKNIILSEAGGGWSHPPQPSTGDATAPDISRREEIGRMSANDIDDDGLASHLIEPEEDLEDCYGPVPPTAQDPYVGQDPFARMTGPLPSKPIYK